MSGYGYLWGLWIGMIIATNQARLGWWVVPIAVAPQWASFMATEAHRRSAWVRKWWRMANEESVTAFVRELRR